MITVPCSCSIVFVLGIVVTVGVVVVSIYVNFLAHCSVNPY